MKDRFTRGFVSGIIAGVPTFIFNSAAFYLDFAALRWSDFAAMLLLGKGSETLTETIFSIVAVYIFLGVLGMVFCYLIPKMSSRDYLLKSWVYSLTLWFFIYAVAHLFKVPNLLLIPFQTVLSHFIGATIWGISLGLTLKWFDNRLKA